MIGFDLWITYYSHRDSHESISPSCVETVGPRLLFGYKSPDHLVISFTNAKREIDMR